MIVKRFSKIGDIAAGSGIGAVAGAYLGDKVENGIRRAHHDLTYDNDKFLEHIEKEKESVKGRIKELETEKRRNPASYKEMLENGDLYDDLEYQKRYLKELESDARKIKTDHKYGKELSRKMNTKPGYLGMTLGAVAGGIGGGIATKKFFSDTKKKKRKGVSDAGMIAGSGAALALPGGLAGAEAYLGDKSNEILRHNRTLEVKKNELDRTIRDVYGSKIRPDQKKQFDEFVGHALNKTAKAAKRYNKQLNQRKLAYVGTGAAIGGAIGSALGAKEVYNKKKRLKKAAETRKAKKLEKTYSSPGEMKVAEPFITKQPVQGKKGIANWIADKIRWKKVNNGADTYEIHRGPKAEKAARFVHAKVKKAENFAKSPKGKLIIGGAAAVGATGAGIYAYKKHKNKKKDDKTK